ncbi:hypothetical protein QN277_013363 [Acacia crassicarpa]|uniref:Uncharacterized protein n=1 Tax=Acacia crassicarpa TaxID=499986 RepID=A0AAE1N2K4_9FABA|nr:hypothetical protein QN277_013363 [Acacia crassicarpa]
MANWRKQQEARRHQVGQWNGSYSRKPPLADRWQARVPAWEKEFCAVIGSVPWPKVVETKKYIYLHDNVLKWDDSAGKEAFDNAKKKFWAEINGLPCDVSLPDPDLHIEHIDWNVAVDPELILDLEREPAPSEKASDEVVILDSSHLLDQSFFCTGWGEAEVIVPTGWEEDEIPPTAGRAEADTLQPPVWEDSGVDVNKQVDTCTGWGEPDPNVNSGGLLQDNVPFPPPPTGWGYSKPNVNSRITGWGEPETDPSKDYHFPPQGWDPHLNAYGGVNYSTGWGEAEINLPKDTDTGEGSWEHYHVPQETVKVSEWVNQENDSWRWKERQQSGFQKTGKGRGNIGNWGSSDASNKRREQVSFRQRSGFQASAYHGNENQMGGRGRRNNRGRKRGGFDYGRSYGDNMATARWEVKTK